MGLIVDTSVLVDAERQGKELPKDDEPAAIAAITASELLHGLYRARTSVQRVRREAFITSLFECLPVVSFDLPVARVHARLWAELLAAGTPIGTHDLMIAATAQALGWSVWTLNARDFARIPGTEVFALP